MAVEEASRLFVYQLAAMSYHDWETAGWLAFEAALRRRLGLR